MATEPTNIALTQLCAIKLTALSLHMIPPPAIKGLGGSNEAYLLTHFRTGSVIGAPESPPFSLKPRSSMPTTA